MGECVCVSIAMTSGVRGWDRIGTGGHEVKE